MPPMIRKLILATAAVMALSTGAQAANVINTTQNGNQNNSSTVQTGSAATSNLANLVQLGFFNNGSAGQTGGANDSEALQAGGHPVSFNAARNVLSVGQNGLGGTNLQNSIQLNSDSTAASFSATPLN